MIAQFLLTAILSLLLLFGLTQKGISPIIGRFVILFCITAGYFTWMPSHSTIIASSLGIGRGVDLAFYFMAIFCVISFVNIHIKIRLQNELITELARKIALSSAKLPAEGAAGNPTLK